MTYYRLYFFNGSRIERAEEIHADDDAAAIGLAKLQAGSRRLELWCGSRKIGEVMARHSVPQQDCLSS